MFCVRFPISDRKHCSIIQFPVYVVVTTNGLPIEFCGFFFKTKNNRSINAVETYCDGFRWNFRIPINPFQLNLQSNTMVEKIYIMISSTSTNIIITFIVQKSPSDFVCLIRSFVQYLNACVYLTECILKLLVLARYNNNFVRGLRVFAFFHLPCM